MRGRHANRCGALPRNEVRTSRGELREYPEPPLGAQCSYSLAFCAVCRYNAASMTQPGSTTAPRRRILVAEDEELILRVFEAILGKAGFEVVSAENGNRAVSLFDAESESIDLVITDLSLPGLTGELLAAHVRKTRPNLPIIFSTGNITDAPNKAVESFPGALFLPKPFGFEDLTTIVNQALSQAIQH
jgi:CheY-like chemotaxis protein